MIEDKTILAIIPARGGSKGVPRKNIRVVAGKPLMAWTIEEALKSKYIDRIIVSTDDDEIAATAKEWGAEVPFMRPAALSTDNAPGIEPVIHAINMLPQYEYVIVLQPTSPLRTVDDIDGSIELCFAKRAKCCVSVVEPDKSPYWMLTLGKNGKVLPLFPNQTFVSRRQDLPAVYALNGAIYIAKSEYILRSKTFIDVDMALYIMTKDVSVDIDTEYDLLTVEHLMKIKNNPNLEI